MPGGMDTTLKSHYDKFRGELPPELLGIVEGKLLPNVNIIKKMEILEDSAELS